MRRRLEAKNVGVGRPACSSGKGADIDRGIGRQLVKRCAELAQTKGAGLTRFACFERRDEVGPCAPVDAALGNGAAAIADNFGRENRLMTFGKSERDRPHLGVVRIGAHRHEALHEDVIDAERSAA